MTDPRFLLVCAAILAVTLIILAVFKAGIIELLRLVALVVIMYLIVYFFGHP